MIPLYTDPSGKAVFTTTMIDIYGYPEENGFKEPYLVIEGAPDYTYTYDQIQRLEEKYLNRHIYCRGTRFRLLLYHLIGVSDSISSKAQKCLAYICNNFKDIDLIPREELYDSLRMFLKKHKYTQYYHYIPSFLRELNVLDVRPKNPQKLLNMVLYDFLKMHHAYTMECRNTLKRVYFPNLKFVALKLLQRYGYKHPLNIPMAKSKNKLKQLDKVFDFIWSKAVELDIDRLE